MPTVQLTPEQKVKVRVHLGYPNVAASATFALGHVASLEISHLIERAMDKLLPEGRTELARILAVLDQIEQQMIDDLELLAVDSIGEITLRKEEQRQLTERYNYWVEYISNMLTVPRNPFDARLKASGTSINARVL